MSCFLPLGRLLVFCVALSTLAVAEPSGTYLGLIDADGPLASGSIQIVLTRGGHGSLSIRLGNQAPVAAKVTVDGSGQIVAGRLPGGITLDLFVLPQADGSSTITGDILMPNSGAQINLAPPATAARAAEAAGRYTLQFDHAAAGGDSLMGVATVVVSPNGAARLVSGLSDGTVLSQGGSLDSNGNLLLFQGHPGTHSTFQMMANFAPDGSVAGSGKAVAAAGTETATIRGARFLASANFGLPSSGTLSTSSAVDPTAVVTATGLTSPPRLPTELRVAGVVPANVRVDVRTGFATGDYTVTVAGKHVVRHLTGAVFQDRNATVGFVTQGTKRVGEFALTLDGLTSSPVVTTGGTTTATGVTVTTTAGTVNSGSPVSGGTLSLGGNSGGSLDLSGGYDYGSGVTVTVMRPTYSGRTLINGSNNYLNSGSTLPGGNPLAMAATPAQYAASTVATSTNSPVLIAGFGDLSIGTAALNTVGSAGSATFWEVGSVIRVNTTSVYYVNDVAYLNGVAIPSPSAPVAGTP